MGSGEREVSASVAKHKDHSVVDVTLSASPDQQPQHPVKLPTLPTRAIQNTPGFRAEDTPADEPPSPTRDPGRYHFVGEHGRGGLGVVYEGLERRRITHW